MYINTKTYMYLRLVKKSFYVNLLLFLFLLLLVQLQHLVETQVRYISCTIIKIGYQNAASSYSISDHECTT